MAEEAGYRVKEGNIVSDILRKQWYVGKDEKSIRGMVRNIAYVLLANSPINNGIGALREDLDIGRLTAAMYASLYDAPFDSIEKDLNCDIPDLFEIELSKWNIWKVNYYTVGWRHDYRCKMLSKPITIATVFFDKDKSLEEGMYFKWLGEKCFSVKDCYCME